MIDRLKIGDDVTPADLKSPDTRAPRVPKIEAATSSHRRERNDPLTARARASVVVCEKARERERERESSSLSPTDVIELCDLDHDESISLKEFIVTLALLYLLKAVPSLRSVRHGEPRTSDEPSPSTPDHNRRHSVDKLSLAALAADGESPHALDYSVGDDEGAFLNCSTL